MVNFAKNLSELRKARHLTQLELAELIGIQTRLIGRWEQGQGKPQFDYILKLADALEVSLDRLLRGNNGYPTEDFEIKNRKLKELCKKVDQLRKEEQEMICHFLDMAIRSNQIKHIVTNH